MMDLTIVLTKANLLTNYIPSPPNPPIDFNLIVNIVVAVLTFAGLIVTVALSKQRTRKGMSYSVVSNTSIVPELNVGEQIKGKIQLTFNNKPVSDAHLVVLKVWNSGNIEIRPEDYENKNPLKLDFGENADILNCEIIGTSPQSLKTRIINSFQPNTKSIILEPLLLNEDDSITLKVLVSNFTDQISTEETRIAGIKQIQRIEAQSFEVSATLWLLIRWLWSTIIAVILIGLFVNILYAYLITGSIESIGSTLLPSILNNSFIIALLLGFLILTLISYRLSKRPPSS